MVFLLPSSFFLPYCYAFPTGNVTVHLVPFPGVLSTSNRPLMLRDDLLRHRQAPSPCRPPSSYNRG